MLSKSNVISNVRYSLDRLTPIQLSGFLHGITCLVIIFAFFVPAPKKPAVEISIIESPKVSPSAQLKPIAPLAPKRVEPPKKRAVFGASRKSITSEDGESVKAGNTVAKEVDTKKLTDKDVDSLPIPADEYMVSAMPQIEVEVRAPYPPQAREKRIQGAVVMDLLIDAEGKVREAKLVSGPGSGLNEAALEAAKGFKFKPAQIQDQKVAVRIRYAYRFILEK